VVSGGAGLDFLAAGAVILHKQDIIFFRFDGEDILGGYFGYVAALGVVSGEKDKGKNKQGNEALQFITPSFYAYNGMKGEA